MTGRATGRATVYIAALAAALLLCAAPGWGKTPEQEPAPPQKVDGNPENIARLVALLAKDDWAGRDASRQLGKIGKPAVPELLKAIRHTAPRSRYWAISALSSIGDERALPAIKKCLQDKDGIVRAVATWHLGRWFDREDVRTATLAMLADRDEFVRGWALRLLVEKRHKKAAPQVLAMLKDKNENVRYDVLRTLAMLQGADALATLKNTLKTDKSALVREGALRCCTIVKPRSPATAEVLILGLSDESIEVREMAARLLRKGFDQCFGFRPKDTVGERQVVVGKWQDWYSANKKQLNWDKKRRLFTTKKAPPAKTQKEPADPAKGKTQ